MESLTRRTVGSNGLVMRSQLNPIVDGGVGSRASRYSTLRINRLPHELPMSVAVERMVNPMWMTSGERGTCPLSRRVTRRKALATLTGAVIGAGGLLRSTASAGLEGVPMSTPETTNTTPTIVLVHGAFAESASWNDVIADLQRRGYTTISAANPLRGLEEDAAYVRSVIESVPGPVVAVGHSYGGSVLTVAADGLPNVTALVYIASIAMDVGESTADMTGKFPGNLLGTGLQPVPFPKGNGERGEDLYIRQHQFRELFAADVAPELTEVLAATQRPIAANALTDKATRAAWKTIPSWFLVATQDLAIPAAAQRYMAERAGSAVLEIEASHAVAVSQPDVVAGFIDEAARATSQANAA